MFSLCSLIILDLFVNYIIENYYLVKTVIDAYATCISIFLFSYVFVYFFLSSLCRRNLFLFCSMAGGRHISTLVLYSSHAKSICKLYFLYILDSCYSAYILLRELLRKIHKTLIIFSVMSIVSIFSPALANHSYLKQNNSVTNSNNKVGEIAKVKSNPKSFNKLENNTNSVAELDLLYEETIPQSDTKVNWHLDNLDEYN